MNAPSAFAAIWRAPALALMALVAAIAFS